MSTHAIGPIVSLRGIRKTYGAAVAIDSLDLEVPRGAFFTLLGPSGSGKTTTLRLIAGFEFPDRGSIFLDGKDVARLTPQRRDVNTVFQDYALFPHMTLLENVSYGLLAKRVPKQDALRRAQDALDQVQLGPFAARKPGQLSGGQRQRVALARAIVNRPSVLLLDEPLGALDLKLRHHMQVELKALQAQTGITFIYVTHDQEEALTMSDHVAVFDAGRIQQIGTPADIYERPATAFVAGFVGTATLLGRNGATLMIRPENIRVLTQGTPVLDGEHAEPGIVRDAQYLGTATRLGIDLADGTRIFAATAPGTSRRPGEPVLVSWRRDETHIIPGPPE